MPTKSQSEQLMDLPTNNASFGNDAEEGVLAKAGCTRMMTDADAKLEERFDILRLRESSKPLRTFSQPTAARKPNGDDLREDSSSKSEVRRR